MSKKKSPKPNSTEDHRNRSLDTLAEYDDYRQEIAPILRQAVKEKWTAEKLWSHPVTQAMMAARLVNEGITNPDASKALAAIKDVMDRTVGKPTERKEIKHSLEKLSDEELQALLDTEEAELNDEDDGAPLPN